MLEWVIRKKEIQHVLVRSVQSVRRARRKGQVDSELSEEFEVKVGMHQVSVLSPLLFFQWWKMLPLNLPEVVLSESLYADDLVLMSETFE